MGYLHIGNLYKAQDILLFRECYALEKIHGTSAHVGWKDGVIRFFSGGVKHGHFKAVFDVEDLVKKFTALDVPDIVIFGEAYGGKIQGMKDIYGPDLRFVVFDVKINKLWLAVPQMDQVARELGFEVVDWVKISTELEAIDMERDRPSIQAERNGCGSDKLREGIVLRPPIEVTKNNGERIIAKHKGEAFAERVHTPKVKPDKLEVMTKANAIAEEWVTEMRLSHVLDRIGATEIEQTRQVIEAMVEDVEREAAGEIITSNDVRRAICSRAAKMFKARLQAALGERT